MLQIFQNKILWMMVNEPKRVPTMYYGTPLELKQIIVLIYYSSRPLTICFFVSWHYKHNIAENFKEEKYLKQNVKTPIYTQQKFHLFFYQFLVFL